MKMNKTIFAGLAILGLLLSGCGSKASNNQPEPEPEHQHTYSDTWSYDSNYHWHEATCGHNLTKDKAPHQMSGWNVVTDATTTSTGLKRRHCNVCPYSQDEVIPMIESHTIGQNGGTVTDSGNNVQLVFPQGALTEETGITVTYHESDDSPVEESQEAFLCGAEFGPSGTVFNEPVEVSLKLNSTPKNETLSVFCYDETYGVWDYVTEATISGSQAVFSVTHFSEYHVLDITPEMYAKFHSLVRQAQANGYSDQWVIDSYKEYLLNEKHIMDYYKLDNGLWYEPTYLFVSGNYHINGQEGDPDELYFREGESNKVGNKYGLSTVGGETVSTTDYKKATDTTQETITVTIDLQYKLIKPTIELSAGTTHLEEGESTDVQVYCHYAKPSNTLYPDLELEGYTLTIPTQLVHLSVNKTTLVTNSSGRTSFRVTAIDEMPESIKVMFYVEGNWGEYAASYIAFNKSGIYGHIKEEKHLTYKIPLDESNAHTLVQAGSFDIVVEYDFEVELNENNTANVSFTNASASFTSQGNIMHKDYSGGDSVTITYDVFKNIDSVTPADISFIASASVSEGVCSLSTSDKSTIATINGNGHVHVSSVSQGTTHNSSEPDTFVATIANSSTPILDFELEEGSDTIETTTFKDACDITATYMGDTVSFEGWNFKILSQTETTTQTINIA